VPAVVVQNLGAFDDVGLALVDLGHLASGARETALQCLGDFGMKNKFTAERLGHGFACDVVFGGAQAAGEIAISERLCAWRIASARRSHWSPTTHLATTSTPRLFSSPVKIERVGIDALRRQHFRADRK